MTKLVQSLGVFVLVCLSAGCASSPESTGSGGTITLSSTGETTAGLSLSSTFVPSTPTKLSNLPINRPTETVAFSPMASFTSTSTGTALPLPRLLLVYWSDGNIFALRPPSEAVQVAAFTGAFKKYISDDGKKILFLAGFDSFLLGIRAVNSDGSGHGIYISDEEIAKLSLVNSQPDAKLIPESVVWIPQSHNILFSTDGTVYRGGRMPNHDLFKVNTDTGELIQIFEQFTGGWGFPSPDGEMMVVQHHDVISINEVSGKELYGNLLRLTNDQSGCFAPFFSYPAVWASDSSRFDVIIPAIPCDTDMSNHPVFSDSSVWSVMASTGEVSLRGTIKQSRSSVLSPALDRVWYNQRGDDPSRMETFVSTIDGYISIHVASGPTSLIAFAPDGGHFAYYTGTVPDVRLFIGSVTGELLILPGSVAPLTFQWINNDQFIYQIEDAVWLGDIGGNSALILKLEGDACCVIAKDLDY